MEYEFKVVALPLDENMQAAAEGLAAEGWQTVQGAQPVVIYHLVRAKGWQAAVAVPGQMAGAFAHGEMRIDEDKVFIRGPDGKVRKN